ncbi:hypothetical protein, partial [Mesobacillus zeae]
VDIRPELIDIAQEMVDIGPELVDITKTQPTQAAGTSAKQKNKKASPLVSSFVFNLKNIIPDKI